MVRMVRAGVYRGGRTVLVLDACRVYDGFQGYGREWMSVEERDSALALHPWVPYGERESSFRYHDLDIYPSDLSGSYIV